MSEDYMSPEEKTARQRVIAEAETWLGTPFHFGARVKGAGVDCAQFIAAVFEACGIFRAEEWGFFGKDWHLNTDEDHYRYRLVRHASELPVSDAVRPGDVALVKVGRAFSHGGIVIAWPNLICAGPIGGVKLASAELDPMWVGWEKLFFDPFIKLGSK
jgi:cell wall-associated NlpC family hydrolase